MNNDVKVPEVIFAPGCFDNFEGTQEELDELVAEINRLVTTGELFNNGCEISDITDDEFTDDFYLSTVPRTLN